MKIRWWVATLLLVNVALYLWITGIRPVKQSGLTVAKPDIQPGQLRLYVPPVITAQKDYCLRIGPFATRSKAVLSRTLLTTTGVQALALESSADRMIKAYRIYMGPFENRSDTGSLRDYLNQMGNDDQYLVRESDGSLVISLGLFTQNDGADRFLNELRSKGISANKREEMRSLGDNYWLLLRAGDEDKIKYRSWPDPRAGLHRVVCP